MTHFFKINGHMYTMENAVYRYRPAGRARRWCKFVTGLVKGKLITLCLHVANMVEVAKNVARHVIEAHRDSMAEQFRQRVLMDATLLAKG